jgi:hypothetical protein
LPYSSSFPSSCASSKIAREYLCASCKFSMANHQSCPCPAYPQIPR